MTNLENLINQEEGSNSASDVSQGDEDRKFLRAAAEAIVATSMNSQIDPTILELLKRIQYASNDTSAPPLRRENSQDHQQANNHLYDPHDSIIDKHIRNDFDSHDALFGQSNIINPLRTTNQNHFPTFNLNYFDSLSNNPVSSTTSVSSTNISSANNATGSNDWNTLNNGNVIFTNHRQNSISTPNSVASTSPGTSTPPSGSMQQSQSRTRRNSSDKPFACKDCSLSFRRSSDLRRHQRAHLPILPHICQLCGKGFARKDALKRHSDTLTCKRNREKLLSSGGDLDSILEQSNGHK